MTAQITALYRYPFKGMSPETLSSVHVAAQQGLPLDRRFALAHGNTQFDVENPQHLPKTKFLMLMKNEKLAALETAYNESTGIFSIKHNNQEQARGDLSKIEGRQSIERFLQHYLGEDIQGQAKIVQAPNHMFSDVAAKVLSFINLASVRELEKRVNAPLDPLRFRANVYIDGVPAWSEFDWQRLQIGEVQCKALKATARCAATNVNPHTAQRDQSLPQVLLKTYGHRDMGMYMQVETGGELRTGMAVKVL